MRNFVIPRPHAEITVESADGALFKVRRHGNPSATVRLYVSHGNGFAIDGYFHFWRRFLAGFEVVAFDMRSHGRNPTADSPHHDYAHMVEDIAAIGGAVDGEFGRKPAAGLFHSMSAQSALLQTMAAQGPRDAHFDALVLFDPPNVPQEGHPVRSAMVAYEHKLARWAGHRREHFADPEELAAEYARTRSGRRWPTGAAPLLARAVMQRGAEGWALSCPRELEASMYLQGIDLGLWPRRCEVPVPVTLIGADPDCPFHVATGLSNRALAAEGGFDYSAIRGTSHLLQLEEPDACADAALAAIERGGFG